MIRTVQELLDILNNPHEIPRPDLAEICFYFQDENGETVDLKLKSIGAFNISTDITFTFEEDNYPALLKTVNIGEIKPSLQGAKTK